MQNKKSPLPIVSILPRGMIIKPIILWLFVGFVAFCLFDPTDKKPYPLVNFLFFMFFSAVFFIAVAFINYMQKQRLVIDGQTLCITNVYHKVTGRYYLSNIIDFQWNNLPYVSGQGSINPVRLKNELITLFFKDGQTLTIPSDQFENFDVIKNYLFNYCVDAKIITIRPLEERKRSSFQRHN